MKQRNPPPAPAPPGAQARRRARWIALALGVGTFLLYVPSFFNDFVTYDDPHYIHEQPMVRSGLTLAGIRWAFTTTTFANWLPITWLSHQLDVQLWGLHAGGHHASSAVLHAVNAALVFLCLRAMTGSVARAAAVAAVFAVHPLRVESVAWVAERKDVLAGTFFLLTLLAYVAYARRPSPGRYGVALVCFALGLMSKTMLVSAPCVLLLLDYWPLRRMKWRPDAEEPSPQFRGAGLGWLVAEKIPFLALAAIASAWTVALQAGGGAMQGGEAFPPGRRLANAAVSIPRYLDKIVRPTDLSIFYPYPAGWPPATVALSVGLIAGISALAVLWRRRRPYLAVGWFWFLGMLVPVVGIVQVGLQSMADRYTYLPGIGLLISVVWLAAALLRTRPAWRRYARPVGGLIVIGLCVATVLQQRYWANTFALFTHAYVVDPNNWLANDMLGVAHSDAQDYPTAAAYLSRAAALNPAHAEPHHNYGSVLLAMGETQQAIKELEKAIRIKPLLINYRLLAEAQGRQKNWPAVLAALDQAEQMAPRTPAIYVARGRALAEMGRRADAVAQYEAALRIDPNNPEALSALAQDRAAATRPAR